MNNQQKVQNSFYLFCRNMEPDLSFADVHKYIISKAQKTVEEPNGRFMLSVPPGTGKSSIISKLLPAYCLGVNPKVRILLVTYGASLSNSFGKKVREYLESPVYKKVFPNTVVDGEGKSGSFETTEGGFLKCVGRGGAITGFRADIAILDDTIKSSQEAQSDVILTGLWEWATTTLYTRIVPPGSMIVLNTRWCKRDLIQKWSELNPEWPYVNIEALCTDSSTDVLNRQKGESIWPEMYDVDYYKTIKSTSPSTFNTLYQGHPTSQESVPIKMASLEYAATDNYSQQKCFISWDTASTKNAGDYTVATVWKFDKETATIIDLFRKQVGFDGLLNLFDEVNKCYQPVINVVEKASSGIQLIQLRPEQCIPSTCIKVADKEKLAQSFNYSLKNNTINILSTALLQEHKAELAEFPWGTHDDVPMSILHGYKAILGEDLYKISPPRLTVKKALNGSIQTIEKYKSFSVCKKLLR